MSWAAKMAVNLDTGVPWVMCKEDDAPDPVVTHFFDWSFILASSCSIALVLMMFITFIDRLTRAMVFTATISPQTNRTSQLCGPRLGPAGTFVVCHFLSIVD